MSALSFKINAETDKLKSFITMLERLRQVLAEIPDSTKEFDVINRKIGEMEARVEQTMRKIAQMEQQAMDAASKAAASATTGTAGGGSTAGTAATQAETAAYHELIEELRAVNASKRENVALISQYEAQIKRLKSEIRDLNKTESSGIKLTQDQKASRFNASVSIEEYKQALSRARQELANQIKLEQVARGSIDEMSQALGRMRTIYRSLNESERGSSWGQNLLKNIEGLDAKVKELDASMGIHTRKVGDYASGFNMLGFQIQQVARELPSLAYGPQIFFSAISNNLPMLADEIARAKKSVDELKKAGQTFTPVWKQIASSIFSWQTLLVAGVTVLTLYGKEITNWVASLFKGKEAALSLAQAQEKLNTTINEDGYAIGDQIAIIKELQIQWNKLGNNLSSKQQFIKDNSDRFKELDVAVNGVSDAENLLVKNTPNFIEALKLRAEAAAAQKLASESYEKALIEERKAQEQIAKGYHTEAFVGSPTTGGASFNAIDREYTEEEKAGLLAVANAARETADSYMNLKAAKELAARQLLGEAGIQEVGKEKAATEKDIRDLENAIQKLRDDALQAEIDSMKDGTAKKLAQIDLDYQKRARAIQEAEAEIRRLQDGELTKNQQAQIEALNKANEAQHGKERGRTLLSGQTSPEDISSQFDEEIQSWNEYLRKYGNFREKLQATKEYYDERIRKATTQGDRERLKKERDAALAEIETKQSDNWIAFFSWIETMSKSMASNIYNTLRNQLNQMLEAGKISIEEYVRATQQLDQQYRDKLNERGRFQTYQNQGINGLIDNYQKLGDAMQLKGAKTGDQNVQAMGASMSKAAGKASGVISMIDMIVTSIHQTIQAMQQLTDSIVDMMASFGQDAEIDTTLGKWAELSNLMSEFDNHVYSSWEKFKSGDIMGAASEATSSILGVITSINKWIDKSKERKIQKLQDQIDALSRSYDRLSRSIEKAYSTDAKELIEDQNKLLEQQKLLIQRQIQEEKSKKDPDKKRIKEWEKQYEEITNLIEDNAAKAQDAIFGSDIQAAINDFAEAYADAWAQGEDRAKSAKDFVKNMIKQMVIEAMKADIKEPMQVIRDKLEEFWEDGIITQTEENIIDEMIKKLNQDLDASFGWADKYFDDNTASKQQATSRSFQTMSQDTGDELSGRFADIQGKVTDIRGYVMAQTQSIIGLLTSMANIETAMYACVQVNNELLRYAVMTYMEIVEINGSTKNIDKTLVRIEEGINSIKKNTENI